MSSRNSYTKHVLWATLCVTLFTVLILQLNTKDVMSSEVHRLTLPFNNGETWYICQGYNGQISHQGTFALDLSIDPNSPGSTGCTPGTANASTGRAVRAPAGGKIVYRDYQSVCIDLEGRDESIYITHLDNPAAKGAIAHDDLLGTVAAPGTGNGGYAHIHVEIHPGSGCAASGSPIPFDDAHGTRFEGAPNLPSMGTTVNQYSGTALTRDAAVDVFLIVDLSGSFFDDLAVFKAQASDIVTSLSENNPNTRFGLGRFEDYPISPFGSLSYGDKAYERVADLTFDTSAVVGLISGLSVRYGSDVPESQLVALYQAATGAGQDLSAQGYPNASIPAGQQANFRDGAEKIFILWTDAPFHYSGDSGNIPYPGPTFDETVAAIEALDPPMVLGISSGSATVDLARIAAATNALAPNEGVDCNDDGIIEILAGEPMVCTISTSGHGIGEAIIALVEAATEPDRTFLPIVFQSSLAGASIPAP